MNARAGMDTARRTVKITLPMSARSTRPMRRWLAAVLAPVLLVGATAPVEAAARCLARLEQGACCCQAQGAAPETARVERRCCCEVDRPTVPAAPIPTADVAGTGFASSLLAIASAAPQRYAFPTVDSVACPVRTPAVGPPILLLKRSLLI